MKTRFIFLLFLVAVFAIAKGENLMQKFDKSAFYVTIRLGKLSEINNELSILNTSTGSDKEAYEGTLLMRKAGLVAIPGEKLKLFKNGRIKLETVLSKDSTNAEYRFLRLIIQENAPKIVKYKAQLQSDKAYIIKSYKNLSPTIQSAIADYSKSSKILRPQDL
ncbi:MAG: hypothetical protein ABIN91_18260 [Mucilaginibacter sp.]|uniref:hypothetical protein n=1 Tax=Mucilaginibacter sp. TaxID=1882438 RepID=UPI003264C043